MREREDIYTCKSIYRVCLSRIEDIAGKSVATSSSSSSEEEEEETGREGFPLRGNSRAIESESCEIDERCIYSNIYRRVR